MAASDYVVHKSALDRTFTPKRDVKCVFLSVGFVLVAVSDF